jgi:hypothetical protein
MSVKNLEGVIHEELFKLFLIRDGFSVGEKLTQIEKTAKKRFYNMSNEELYDALRETIKVDYFSDTFEQ